MASQQTLEVVRLAERLYEDRLRETLETNHPNEFVAIEPDSGDFFLGSTLSEAIQAARDSYPDRISFALRIGHATSVHLGVMTL